MADGSVPVAKERKKPGPKPGDPTNTAYRPEMCDKIREWGKTGKSKVWMAANLGISRETLDQWAKVHVELSDALTHARTAAQAYWEDLGEQGMMLPGFQGSVWAKNISCRFREDWTESKNVNQTNEDGPNRAAATAQDRARTLELIERLGLAASEGRGRVSLPSSKQLTFPALHSTQTTMSASSSIQRPSRRPSIIGFCVKSSSA
jgi:hypothetical protein